MNKIQSLASSLTITYPTSGTILIKGITYGITWTTTGTVKPGVRIYIYKGVTFIRQLIFDTITGSPWNWKVPTDLIDGNYMINIIGCELISDVCVANITAMSPQFQISSRFQAAESCSIPVIDFVVTKV